MPNKKKNSPSQTYLCHLWGKYNVRNTTFTLESAHQLLDVLQAKKSDHSIKSKLDVFEAGLKLTKKGAFGKTMRIPYLSILRFFVFKTEPHLIFLGVEKRRKLFYVVVLFRELDHVNEICDLIERKKAGYVQKTVDNTDSELFVCRVAPTESKPDYQVSSHEMVNSETQSEPYEEKIVYLQSTEIGQKTPIIRRNIEYHYDERHTDDLGTTRVDALLLRTNMDKNINCNQFKEDIKYIDYNPDMGTATISEVGPIYMYTAHFTPAEYTNFGTCESDDSDWSGDSMSSSEHQGVVTTNVDGKTIIMAHRGSDAGVLF